MIMKETDAKIVEYLERALKIIEVQPSHIRNNCGSEEMIEIAKMIQLADYQERQERFWNHQIGVENV